MQHTIKYLRDCFAEDRRSHADWSLFDRRVESRIFLEGTESLANDAFPYVSVDPEEGRSAAKQAALYRREKELVYLHLFLISSIENAAGSRQGTALPIFLLPAELEEQGEEVLLRVNREEVRFNSQVCDLICEERVDGEALYEEVTSALPNGVACLEDLILLERILLSYCPGMLSDELYEYPRLKTAKALRKEMELCRESEGRVVCRAASCLCLVNRRGESRGLLNELDQLSEHEDYSDNLKMVLSGVVSSTQSSEEATTPGMTPAVLSPSQQGIMESAVKNQATLVIGPPGTGKSFTIASVAIEQISRGQSVLIVCQSNQAVDVLADKIEKQLKLKNTVVRGGKRKYLKEMKQELDAHLQGSSGLAGEVERLREWERRLEIVEETIARMTKRFTENAREEIALGETLGRLEGQESLGLFDKVRYWWAQKQAGKTELLSAYGKEIQTELDDREESIRTIVRLRVGKLILNLLHTRRSDLQLFRKALSARSSGRQEDLMARVDFSLLLQCFPIWLVSASDLHRVLPMKKELFDLLMVDEATQCDLASMLPALQRSRKMVVVGDPNQLGHLTFLSRNRQRILAEQYGLSEPENQRLDYRDQNLLSLLDQTLSSQDYVFFLNEHFRSLPPIIRFSNERFYRGNLRMMTAHTEKFEHDCIEWVQVSVDCRESVEVPPRNPEEADHMLARLDRIIAAEELIDSRAAHSIGLVSPFRDQCDYLAAEIDRRYTLQQIEKHALLVGTAHSFQGAERDVILIGFGVREDDHPNIHRYLNKPDLFNVAITRAKSRQIIFTSLGTEALPAGLLRDYLHELDPTQPMPDSSAPGDPFAEAVMAELQTAGYRVWTSYPIAGTIVDLLVQKDGRSIGIDLIGAPGPYQSAVEGEAYRMFRRASLPIVPLTWSSWTTRKDAALAELLKALDGF